MVELAKKYFDEQFQKLATKEQVAEQVDAVASMVNNAFDTHQREYLDPKLATLDTHTAMLDKIIKNTGHWNTEAQALHSAIKRHEDWIKQLAEKLGVKLES